MPAPRSLGGYVMAIVGRLRYLASYAVMELILPGGFATVRCDSPVILELRATRRVAATTHRRRHRPWHSWGRYPYRTARRSPHRCQSVQIPVVTRAAC